MLPETAPYPYPYPYPDAQRIRILAESHRLARGRVGVARVISSILLGCVVLLILAVIVGMVLGLWRFTVIDTGSMRPTFNPGDVAVLTSEPLTDLQKGQIVAFHPPGEPRLTVMHRVFSIERTRTGVVIQTKGDANNATDQWHAHIVGDTVWHEDFRLPRFGYLAVWSQQRLTRFALLSIVVILMVSMLLGWIWRPTSRRSSLRAGRPQRIQPNE
jgi:signal peptidase I